MNSPIPPSHWFRLWGAICGAFLMFLVLGVVGVLAFSGSEGFLQGALPGAIVGFAFGYVAPRVTTAIFEFLVMLFP
ncbi:hypothetical protein Pan44_16050 [Caulifigura coniformis]|uniref:Uncharacterized protein n=1 Tax=Caulifigura coniformis TaxID=2527983 RepID=A0A517SBT8_9PLAN|nr:hypothetical protein [Caulifigura coniformis]QDT53583.1 hypothetical protein Pan44_16050 [Caulifigura coniformis]